MPQIDLSNYHNTLHQASSNSFTDGNVFFDTVGGLLDLGDASTYASYTPSAASAASTINQTLPDTLVSTTRNFHADGWRAGMKFTLAGTTGNNATFTIDTITTTTNPYDTITTIEQTIVTEAGSGDETLAGAVTTNALLNLEGIKLEAAYAFENQERRLDETIRGVDRFIRGTFKFGGAYDFVFGRKPASDAVRKLFRGSGWRELTGSTENRIYFGPEGLGAIFATSTPSYQTAQYGSSVDFTKLGNIEEAFQVFGDISNGNFDNRLSSHYFSIRTYGNNYDRIDTQGTLGKAELGGYSTGAALNEDAHLTTNSTDHPLASVSPNDAIALTAQTIDFTATEVVLNNAAAADNDWIELGYGVGSSFVITGSTTPGNDTTYVISSITTTTDTNDTVVTTVAPAAVEVGTGTQTLNNVQVAPWTGMTLEKLVSPQTETGFAGADGDFTWTLNNTAAGTLDQCTAYLDAIEQIDAVVTTGTASLNGKDYDVWYTYLADGKIRPVTGASDGFGVFIEGLVGTDKLRVSFIDDNDLVCVYPVYTPVSVELGQDAIDDILAWFHAFIASTFNTGSPTTYDDAVAALVKGSADNTSSFITGANTFVSFEHDFTTDGSTDIVFLCEGDGGVTQQKTAITLADTTVSASCEPAVENNV